MIKYKDNIGRKFINIRIIEIDLIIIKLLYFE